MAGVNKIYPFAQPAVPPNIIDDATYSASSITTTTGYLGGSIAESAFMSKSQRQVSAVAAGIAEFMAVNESGVIDVEDNLSPTDMSAVFVDALSNVSIVTQPQFDNSTKVATTAFTQRALGSFSGNANIAGPTVLTGANVGQVIYIGANSINVGLPLLSSVPDGAQITVHSNGFTGVTLDAQAPDVISNGTGGTSLAGIILNGQEVVTLVKASTAKWYVLLGSVAADNSNSFPDPAGLNAVNGWRELGGGTILQWGSENVEFSSIPTNTEFALPVSWPTAFLNATFNFGFTTAIEDEGGIDASILSPSSHLRFRGARDAGSIFRDIFWTAIGY